MNIDGLENLTLGDLKEIFECNELTISEAMPIMREFRDKHGLVDREATNAFGVAKLILSE